VTFEGPYKILHLEARGCSFEIPPARVVDNKWVRFPALDFVIPEVRAAVEQAHSTVWTDEIVQAYQKANEGEIVASYNDQTLTDEQFARILAAVPDLE